MGKKLKENIKKCATFSLFPHEQHTAPNISGLEGVNNVRLGIALPINHLNQQDRGTVHCPTRPLCPLGPNSWHNLISVIMSHGLTVTYHLKTCPLHLLRTFIWHMMGSHCAEPLTAI